MHQIRAFTKLWWNAPLIDLLCFAAGKKDPVPSLFSSPFISLCINFLYFCQAPWHFYELAPTGRASQWIFSQQTWGHKLLLYRHSCFVLWLIVSSRFLDWDSKYNFTGVVDYLSTEISTSKQKKFPLVTFVDTPGLVDGDMNYPFGTAHVCLEMLGQYFIIVLIIEC